MSLTGSIAYFAVFLFCALAAAQTNRVVVIAHRGEHLHHPDNTLAAYRAALDAGADFIEVDVRTTSDGQLVLMHDGTVQGTTDGHGAIAEMTFGQVRALDAGIRRGKEFAGTRVPTLDEAMEVAGARGGVYLDSKAVAPRALVAAIERHGMAERVVIYGRPAFLKEVLALHPGLKAMPEAGNPELLQSLVQSLGLRVAAFGAGDFNDATIAAARQAHLDIYVDRLGPADNPAVWQDAMDRGATGIQTDKPAELVQYLRAKGYHR